MLLIDVFQIKLDSNLVSEGPDKYAIS
jgi:hypothetical protein